jgi:hypothetical protein
MTYRDIPLIIPVLAAGYVMTIYVVLMLVERNSKITRLGE